MAIADIADSRPTKPSKGPSCETCKLLKRLSDTEAKALRTLLADVGWRYSEISAKLAEREGIDIAGTNLARHARGDCAAREKLR